MFDAGMVMILASLMIVAALYSSVGHGGASGYLAVLSLSSFAASNDAAWLKQHAWILNLLVAGIAFHHFRREGHHDFTMTKLFIVASVPFAFLGGYLVVDGEIYDVFLSVILLLAAWRLMVDSSGDDVSDTSHLESKIAIPTGAGIGMVSGMIGVGGGIFLSPILMLKGWATPKGAAATAAAFIWVNSLAGLGGAAVSGQIVLDIDVLVYFLVAVGIGGIFGSRIGSAVVPQLWVKRFLVVVLIIASARRVLGLFGLWF